VEAVSSGCSSARVPVLATVNQNPTVTANSTGGNVCPGTSITLTGGGALSYTWNNGVIDGSPFIAGSSQIYSVTGLDANGCRNTASFMLIVVTCTPVWP